MPPRVLPDVPIFEQFRAAMIQRRFRVRELSTMAGLYHGFIKTTLGAPRKHAGHETGFSFTANGLEVVVWTTFLDLEGRAREDDSGWVVIVDLSDGKGKYFSHPMNRTENFLRRLFCRAMIAKERVLKRPRCPTCGRFMDITKGKKLKSRYWSCANDGKTLRWDNELSERTLAVVKRIRKERSPYRDKRKEQGKPVGVAMLTRNPWQRVSLQ